MQPLAGYVAHHHAAGDGLRPEASRARIGLAQHGGRTHGLVEQWSCLGAECVAAKASIKLSALAALCCSQNQPTSARLRMPESTVSSASSTNEQCRSTEMTGSLRSPAWLLHMGRCTEGRQGVSVAVSGCQPQPEMQA